MFKKKEKPPKPKKEKKRKKRGKAAPETELESAEVAENRVENTESVADELPQKEPFLKRLIFGEPKPDLSELESGSTTVLDILSPTSVDTKSRDYIVVDDVYHAYLYITGYGYSTTVGSCWLSPLVEAGEGVSVSFTFQRQSKEKSLL